MQLQVLVTLAAALLATSANALPYVGKDHRMPPAAYARLHPTSDDSSSSSSALSSTTKRQSRSSTGGLDVLIDFVRRQGSQQPMMTSSIKKSLGNEKRGDVNSGVPGAAAAALKAAKEASVSSSSESVSSTTSTKTDKSSKSSSSSFVSTGGSKLSVGYWAEWTADVLSPESIKWSKYDVMNYAFAIPNSDGTITLDYPKLLKRMVTAAHANGTKLVLSVGGAGQSTGFVEATASTSAIATFVKNLVALQTAYNLDGFDFDWEYPNDLISSRKRSTKDDSGEDTKNFQTFLQTLRPALPSGTIISAAVPQSLWQGSSGDAVGSVARAASALDYIFIMSYDTWGSSSTPGPNSPLANLCGNSTQPIASAAGGVKAWTSAGMPRSKIVLGLPMYGYINTSSKRVLIQRRGGPQRPQRRTASVVSSDDTTGSGQIDFNSMVSQGALTLSNGVYVAGSGWTKYWDGCSDSPYLANGKYVLTYDDPVSLQDKAEFAYDAGLAGAGVWSIEGDTSDYALIDAIRTGLKK